ncbi:UNVERIFIED_CONTAM: AP-1 complex subunit gamma-2 [Sesamum latifolium]|uniref:AP-1 complex subunit gamma-2 n=1 Tax=Sesamum latifolium TaxID=2727402 RepID=A0AAW2X0K2_9LAMI
MARDLAPEVERLLQFRDPNVRKKAALCTIRIIKKVPDLAENFITPAVALLKEKHHGVLLTGVQLCTDLSKVSTEALEYFKTKSIDGLVKVLRDLANSPYSPEYDISGITDPFLHIRLLKFLRVLGQGDADASDTMNDILAQVATRTEANKNAGNAILYECVATIMSIEDNGGLRVLAVNILGRFLSSRDNNIRYVALNMLMKAIALDTQAVQRHRVTILECVKDSDASIRKRALELVCLLVNENNVKSLTKELIDYLEVSEPEFKGDLTAKICSIVEKFSPEKIWYIDQMLKVLSEAGNNVKDDVWHALIVVITNAPNLHGYTVRSLYKALQTAGEQETLIRVAVWCIGEYGDLLISNAGVLDVEDPITEVLCLNCNREQLSSIPLSRSIRKSGLHWLKGCQCLMRQPLVGGGLVLCQQQFQLSQGDPTKIPNGVVKPTSAPLVDLLDLSSDDTQAPASSGGDFLQDLLGVDVSPATSQGKLAPSPSAQAPSPVGSSPVMDLLGGFGTSQSVPVTNGPTFPAIVAFESSSLKVIFSFSKEPDSPQTTLIEAQFINKSPNVYSNFLFQAAVPKFLQLHLDPASSNTLPASGNGSVSQKLRVSNSQHGKKSLVMRVRINYKVNDKDVLEEGQISNFPRDL